MADAKLIMLDEPSLGLAPLLIEQIYEALGALRAEGRSFLVVEENPSRLMTFADRLCLMDAGQFAWSGTTDEARRLHITFTLRGEGTRIRVISARVMHRKERSVYEQAAQGDS